MCKDIKRAGELSPARFDKNLPYKLADQRLEKRALKEGNVQHEKAGKSQAREPTNFGGLNRSALPENDCIIELAGASLLLKPLTGNTNEKGIKKSWKSWLCGQSISAYY